MSARAVASVAAGLMLITAGCGGGSSSGGGDGSWGQRADAICERAEKEIRAIDAPEDIGDLDRVMVRASEEIRAAIADLRELEISSEEKQRAKAFLADLGIVETSLGRISDATSTGERRPIEKAGRAFRLDAVDIAAHAEEAGLTRCGREATGVAAADAVLLPAYAEQVGEAHARFVVAEGLIAGKYDPKGAVGARARYWVALWELIKRSERSFGEPPEGELAKIRATYWDAYNEMYDAADVLSSLAKGEVPISSDRVTEAQGRRRVKAFEAGGFALLEQLGPAGKAQLRALKGLRKPSGGAAGGQES